MVRDRLKRHLVRRSGELHREEGGAVMLLCLAALLILFMVFLIIYDAGKGTRAKMELQMAGDTAAYSAASVKARALNMVAFNNVIKRSIVSSWAMYNGMYVAYILWYLSRVAKCFKTPPNLSACKDVLENFPIVLSESLSDFVPKGGMFVAGADYEDDLQAIQKYQDYMSEAAPWLAWGEAIARGTANGASMVGTWPPPPHALLTSLPDLVEKALNFFGMSPLYNQTLIKDELPVEAGGAVDLCFSPKPEYAIEQAGNLLYYRNHSEKGAKKGSVIAGGLALAVGFCLAAPGETDPMMLSASGEGGEALAHKGYLVFAWRAAPETQGKLRDNYNYVDKEYGSSMLSPATYASGFWSLSRAEVVTPGEDEDMWRAAWTAKMRPVALDGELADGSYNLNGAWRDVIPYMAVGALIGVLTGGSFTASLGDFLAMEKATRGMDNSALDGMHK